MHVDWVMHKFLVVHVDIKFSSNPSNPSNPHQNMWAILKRHVFAILSNPQQSWIGMFLQSLAILSNPESACFCNPLQSFAILNRHVFAILCNPDSACFCNPLQSSAILNRHVFAILAILKQSFEPRTYQTYNPGAQSKLECACVRSFVRPSEK